MKRSLFFLLLASCMLSNIYCNDIKEIENYSTPKTLEQSIRILNKTMSEQDKFLIKTLSIDSILTHIDFKYGTDFSQLWLSSDKSPLVKYFNAKGLIDYFGMYKIILTSYQRYLNDEKINVKSQISDFNKNRYQESVDFFKKQKDTELNNIIKNCLSDYTDYLKKYIENNVIKQSYLDNFYICIDNFPPNFRFEEMINGVKVKYISIVNYQNIEKRLKKGINGVIFLENLDINKNSLNIDFSWKNVKLVYKNQLSILLSEYAHFVYKYSCEEEKWILTKTKYGGI